MICPNCGNEIQDGTMVCTCCGTKLQETKTPFENNSDLRSQQPALTQPDLPMKWYKFVIYFSLFECAVSDIYSAYTYFFGGNISGTELLYGNNEGLRLLDIGYGIIYIVFAVFAICTRNALAKFKKAAPKMYYIYNIAHAIFGSVYFIFSSIIVGSGLWENMPQIIGLIVGMVIRVVCCVIYFNKREQLFVN